MLNLEKKHQMKKILLFTSLTFFVAICLSLFSNQAISYPDGAPAGNTGSPADGSTCSKSGCHSGTPTNQAGIITSDVPTTGYTPGTTYNISITFSGSGNKGFQVSPQAANGNVLGSLIAGTGTKILSNKYVTHTSAKNTASCSWTFKWVAPAAGTGDVTFYGAFAITDKSTRKSTLVLTEASTVQGVSNEPTAKISLYPNPANDIIKIKLESSIDNSGKAMLFDQSGKLIQILNFNSNEFNMNIQNLPAGNYFLRINDGQNNYFNHFIKN